MNMEFWKAANEDTTVYRLLQENASYEAICIALARDKAALVQRIIELESIAPRRFKVGDTELVWQCPVHLIPLTEKSCCNTLGA